MVHQPNTHISPKERGQAALNPSTDAHQTGDDDWILLCSLPIRLKRLQVKDVDTLQSSQQLESLQTSRLLFIRSDFTHFASFSLNDWWATGEDFDRGRKVPSAGSTQYSIRCAAACAADSGCDARASDAGRSCEKRHGDDDKECGTDKREQQQQKRRGKTRMSSGRRDSVEPSSSL